MMEIIRKMLTIVINILYFPIGAYLFSINNENVMLQWILKTNNFLSEQYYISYEKINDWLLTISIWSFFIFLGLKIIRFFLKSDIRKLKMQNKKLSDNIRSLEKDKDKIQEKYEKLSEDTVLLKENFDNTLKGFLSTFARNILSFGSLEDGEKNNERITFFTYDYEEKEFTLQVRYSSNIAYDKNGKIVYDAEKGIIGKALKNDEDFDNNFPDAYIEGKLNTDYISYHNKKYGLTKAEVQGLTMKSVFMYAYAIKDETKNIGVVVIESTKRNRYEKSFLHDIMERNRKAFKPFMMYAIKNKVRENLRAEGF